MKEEQVAEFIAFIMRKTDGMSSHEVLVRALALMNYLVDREANGYKIFVVASGEFYGTGKAIQISRVGQRSNHIEPDRF